MSLYKEYAIVFFKNWVTKKKTDGVIFQVALLRLVFFLVAPHGSGRCVSVCFTRAILLLVLRRIAAESLPFFGKRRVSWLTSNCPSHVAGLCFSWFWFRFLPSWSFALLCTPATRRWDARGICIGSQSTAHGQRGVSVWVYGEEDTAACPGLLLSEFTFGQSLPLPHLRRGLFRGPLSHTFYPETGEWDESAAKCGRQAALQL